MRTHIEIITPSLENNCSIIKSFSNHHVGCVVKSNAYGHGVHEIVRYITQKKLGDMFFVAYSYELEKIRYAGWHGPLVLFGYVDEIALQDVSRYSASCTVYSLESARFIADFAQRHATVISVHIELDTGMHRLGLRDQEFQQVIDIVYRHAYLNVAGIFTHCFDTAQYDTNTTRTQFLKFDTALVLFKKYFPDALIHACPTGALGVDNHYDMTRCGSALYGLWKSPLHKKRILENHQDKHFKQIMRWKSTIAQIKEIACGDFVGYNKLFCAAQSMRIATIPVGYADGYSRLLTEKAGVIIHGAWAPLCGYISMNMLCVDITHIPHAQVNDEVLLSAPEEEYPEISLATLADHIKIPAIAFAAGISEHIPRILVEA